jgi:hypothetical protein
LRSSAVRQESPYGPTKVRYWIASASALQAFATDRLLKQNGVGNRPTPLR